MFCANIELSWMLVLFYFNTVLTAWTVERSSIWYLLIEGNLIPVHAIEPCSKPWVKMLDHLPPGKKVLVYLKSLKYCPEKKCWKFSIDWTLKYPVTAYFIWSSRQDYCIIMYIHGSVLSRFYRVQSPAKFIT